MVEMKKVLLTIWKILWKVILFFCVWAIPMALIIIPTSGNMLYWHKKYPLEMFVISNILTVVTILLATWVMVRIIDKRDLKSVGFYADHIFRDSLAGLATGTLWLVASVVLAIVFGFAYFTAPVEFSWFVLMISSIAMLFNVVTQELLLCGFIFQTIRKESNTFIAVVVSAILFASYHAGAFKGAFLPIVNVFAAGILFCLAFVITKNLWFPIFIHFAWDVLLGPVLGLTESGKNLGGGWKMFELKGNSLFTGGQFGLEGGLIATFTAFVNISLIYYFQGNKIEKNK